jgi:hypothetical protein
MPITTAAALFPADLLRDELARFRAVSAAEIREKQDILVDWIAQLHSGKLAALKEEEIKSRFITEIFGDVLGFNYGNSKSWQLREEVKTRMDGTKPDAALGYFGIDRQHDRCQAVIEMKDAATDLDAPQKRKIPKSAVEQGFEYAPKMGGECRWVIVSNFREIRFYQATDRTRYQSYQLEELREEPKLKELLYLFHKDRFLIRQGESGTERLLRRKHLPAPIARQAQHVVDELYAFIKQFEGLSFVDPHYLAALYPFNILSQNVQYYDTTTLFTINPHICRLLSELTIADYQLILSDTLVQELEAAGVTDYQRKLDETFRFLNQCHIMQFEAVHDYQAIAARNRHTLGFSYLHRFSFAEPEGVQKTISIIAPTECKCLRCLYHDLDLDTFLRKLKASEGHAEFNTLEYAYAHQIAATNNFKTAHGIYLAIERQAKGKAEQGITYFLAKANRLHLHNLLSGSYFQEDQEQLLTDLRDIDLLRVIQEELADILSPAARGYLVEVKEDQMVRRLEDELREGSKKLAEYREYQKRGDMYSAPNQLLLLWNEYMLLYRHLNLNFLVYDCFTNYRSLAKQLFEAVLISYSTRKAGVSKIDWIFLSEALFHISPSDLAETLKHTRKLAVKKANRRKLIAQTTQFLHSFYRDGIFGDPHPNQLLQEFLLNHRFEETVGNLFSNLFILLARLSITIDELGELPKALAAFLRVETNLATYEVKHLAYFIERKGKLLTQNQLEAILELALLENRVKGNRYLCLIGPTATVLQQHYLAYQITDKHLMRRIVAACYNGNSLRECFAHLAPVYHLADYDCQIIMRTAMEEYLDEKFDTNLYETLLRTQVLAYTDKAYFGQYVREVNSHKGQGFRGMLNGHPQFQDVWFQNLALLVYRLELDFNLPELSVLTGLSAFEQWLIQPESFNYNAFEAEWLLALHYPAFYQRLALITSLCEWLQVEISSKFSPELYALYHKYFQAS